MTVAVLLQYGRQALQNAARSLTLFPEPYVPSSSKKKTTVSGRELFESAWNNVGYFMSDAMEKVQRERDSNGRAG